MSVGGTTAAVLNIASGAFMLTRTQDAINAVGYKYSRVVGGTVTQFADTTSLSVPDTGYTGKVPDAYLIVPYNSSNVSLRGVRIPVPRRFF